MKQNLQQLPTSHHANRALLEYRKLTRRIERLEQQTEDAAERARQRLNVATAPLRAARQSLKDALHQYYQEHRQQNEKSIKLQDGIIGMRAVPRVEVPKGIDLDDLPPEAVSVKMKVNKTALKALGEEAMDAAGARIVRPLKFYVAPAEEDAEK